MLVAIKSLPILLSSYLWVVGIQLFARQYQLSTKWSAKVIDLSLLAISLSLIFVIQHPIGLIAFVFSLVMTRYFLINGIRIKGNYRDLIAELEYGICLSLLWVIFKQSVADYLSIVFFLFLAPRETLLLTAFSQSNNSHKSIKQLSRHFANTLVLMIIVMSAQSLIHEPPYAVLVGIAVGSLYYWLCESKYSNQSALLTGLTVLIFIKGLKTLASIEICCVILLFNLAALGAQRISSTTLQKLIGLSCLSLNVPALAWLGVLHLIIWQNRFSVYIKTKLNTETLFQLLLAAIVLNFLFDNHDAALTIALILFFAFTNILLIFFKTIQVRYSKLLALMSSALILFGPYYFSQMGNIINFKALAIACAFQALYLALKRRLPEIDGVLLNAFLCFVTVVIT